MFQWFPGHMAKAIRQIKEKEKIVDFFIIVLDGRAPISTYNENFDEISPNKPRIFVITKQDKSDHSKNKMIEQKFKDDKKGQVLFVNLKNSNSKNIIEKTIKDIMQHKMERDLKKGLRKSLLVGFVLGLPNVGKSTLINLLTIKTKAKVADIAGVTRNQQLINTKYCKLIDTPGILFPKIEREDDAIKIAMIGSINWDIINKKELALGAYKLLNEYYPNKLTEINLKPTKNDSQIIFNLENLGKEKNFFTKEGKIDVYKTIEFFNNYVRNLTDVTYD